MAALDLTADWPVDQRQRGGRARGARSSTPSATPPDRSRSPRSPSRSWRGRSSSPSRKGCSASTTDGRAAGLHDPSPAEPCRRVTRSTAPHRSARPSAHAGYSNTGIEIAADALVEAPRRCRWPTTSTRPCSSRSAMDHTTLAGSPAHGATGCVADLARFIAEMRSPTVVSAATRDAAFTSTYPELSGIVPGVGRFAPCPWGLGFELRGDKSPHWTGRPQFGAHGRPLRWRRARCSGSIPIADVGPRRPDRSSRSAPWALDAWPALVRRGARRVGSLTLASMTSRSTTATGCVGRPSTTTDSRSSATASSAG